MKDIFTTMVTPYKADGSVDFDMAEKYVDWYFENGLTGIFAVCQSSEIFYLTLEERVELNRRVYKRAKELEKQHGRKFTVVSSGHVSDTMEEQGDDVFIANAEKLLKMLPEDVKLGLYECPHPYKRLVTPKILDWCLSTGKFYYMKDTCCDAAVMKERCAQLAGSSFKLLNANCQTFLESMQNGGDGYCGIMCNFHPKLYAWMGEHFEQDPEKAEQVQSVIGTFGFTEVGLPYPLTAKYHMNLCGLPTENIARNRRSEELTEYGRSCMQQMKRATDYLEKMLEE